MRKKSLFVRSAVDADTVGQIRCGRPRWNRARWDGSVVDALRRLFTRVDVIGVESGSLARWPALEGTGADVVLNLALSATALEPAFPAFVEAAGLRSTGSGTLALASGRVSSRIAWPRRWRPR